MKAVEIAGSHPNFDSLEVYDVLQLVEQYKDEYIWSIQELEAYDIDIELITDKSILEGLDELEDTYSKLPKGYITDFKTIVELSLAFNDIVEIIITGSKDEASIPTASDIDSGYDTQEWGKYCEVFIARFDSSWWELYSNNPEIMAKFRGLLEENNRLEREIAKKKLKRNLSIISVIIVGLFILIWHLFLTS